MTAVGDPCQSIYGWRGASAGTLERFPADVPGAARAAADAADRSSTSWRNDDAILAVANLTSRAAAPPTSPVAVPAARARARRPGPGAVQACRACGTAEDEAAARRRLAPPALAGRPRRRAADALRPRCSAASARSSPRSIDALRDGRAAGRGRRPRRPAPTPEVSDVVALLWVRRRTPPAATALMRLLTGPLCRLGRRRPRRPRRLGPLLQRRDGARAERVTAPPAAERGPPPRQHAGAAAESAAATAPVRDQAADSADRVEHRRGTRRAAATRLADDRGPARVRCGAPAPAGSARGRTPPPSLTGLSLADLVGEAERALGLDIEVLARPEHTPATARAHLDAFADVAADVRRQRRPAHARGIPRLARRRAVRGARSRQGHDRGRHRTRCRCSPSTPPRAWSGTSSRCRDWSRGPFPPGRVQARRTRTGSGG